MKEKRENSRKTFTPILLPFLATKEEDHECFEYIPNNISENGINISIPNWLVGRDRLKIESTIDLHTPFRLNNHTFYNGKIKWEKTAEFKDGFIYGIEMHKKKPNFDSIFISLNTSEINVDLTEFTSIIKILHKSLKNLYLIKKSILIYINHLVPYFSRISDYPSKDYSELKDVLFNDIKNHISNNIDNLKKLYNKIFIELDKIDLISTIIDLEELREYVESEINMTILQSTFSSSRVFQYLEAIKTLEKQLYLNYNTIVMIYIKSL